MSIILFGAGATYGSGDVSPNIPPLAAGLLTALSAAAPSSWGRLPNALRPLFEEDFERGVTELGNAHPDLLAPLQRAMAEFFFHFVPGPANLYRKLAQRIAAASWKGSLVTLNYERVLQLSLAAEGIRSIYGPPNGAGTAVEVCVPHGVCHIFCNGISAAANAVEFAGMAIASGGSPTVEDDPAEFTRRIRDDAFPPVMSYFDPTKNTTSCANFILQQRARFGDLVTNADRVVVVGVRVRPDDHHLWGPLAESPAELLFCSGASAAEGFNEWADSKRSGRLNCAYTTNFAESFDELCGAVGL